MIDNFATDVATRFRDVRTVEAARVIAHDILDNGDFQKNVPELKAEVDRLESANAITMLMWNAATSGLRWKSRFAR